MLKCNVKLEKEKIVFGKKGFVKADAKSMPLLNPRAFVSRASKIGPICGVTYVQKYVRKSSKIRTKAENGLG